MKLDINLEKEKLYKLLYKIANESKENAYAIYSGFKVGAAILDSEGNVFNGVNIENSSYGATICAERSAISNAVTKGSKDFIAIAIASLKGETWPCGICRQVIFEFSDNIDVITSDDNGNLKVLKIDELLKNGFKLKD